MLRHRMLLDAPDMAVAQVRCDRHDRRWGQAEEVSAFGLVLVRTGVFRRRVNGVDAVLDPTSAYVQRPGEVQQVAHPAGGDVCTSLAVSADLADRLGASDRLHVTPGADLAHRRLVARALTGAHVVELADRATEVIGAVLAEPAPAPRPRLVDDARVLLNTSPSLPLAQLAGELNVSPWYLSRVFHRTIGITVSRYRLRLRARAALEQFAHGGTGGGAGRVRPTLADTAAQLGFADHAHLTRVLRAETGLPASALRTLFGQ